MKALGTVVAKFEHALSCGGVYVNTVAVLHSAVPPTMREFALSVTTFFDTVGIAAAGLLAIPYHNTICKVLEH